MGFPEELDLTSMALLQEVHDILMTRTCNETKILERICEKLLSSLPIELVWGGLIGSEPTLSVVGAAGKEGYNIKGINLDYADTPANSLIRQCINSSSPICLSEGFLKFSKHLSEALSPEIRGLPTYIYPITINNHCYGVLGVSAKQDNDHSRYGHVLMQIAAQHAAFSIGVMRSFVGIDNSKSQLRLAAAVFDCSREGIFITSTAGIIQSANAAVSRITGFENEELIGQNPRIFRSDQHTKEFYTNMWDAINRYGQWEGELWNKRKNGELFPEWLSISGIKNAEGQIENYIGIFIDISKQKEAENHLVYQTYHDPLTRLPNRKLFNDRLDWAILQAKRSQTNCAVLFIDLDHFKYINDTFGHDTGDLLIQKIAIRLKMCLREKDTLARMGGDEFTMILQDFNNHQDAEQTAQRILDSLDNPVSLGDQEIYISASIGISFYPENGDSASQLLKNADAALYSAKNNGRKQIHFFKSSMENYCTKRVEIEWHLRRALEEDEFRIYYQPQIDLKTGKIVGAEALLRWNRPGIGLIPPDQFIQLAEETGMIIPIGKWVLREACSQCRTWQEAGWKSLRIAVNLSALQFKQANLSASIAAILYEMDLEPRFLELELTESVAMQHIEDSLKTLLELKKQGIQIAIDDFGTGYSSLSYLKRFPIGRLKIDRSFIADLATDPNDAQIVISIIAMARCLGLDVIAEGVETEEQLNFLKMHNCNEAQGYLLGEPVPPEEFWNMLSKVAPAKYRLRV